MQLIALNQTVYVAATRAEKGRNYTCPECGSTVRVRGGHARQIHFYHVALPRQCRQHQKSLEHLQLQFTLCNTLGTEGQIESPFPAIGRIADVAWHAKKIVFEIQRSAIAVEEVQQRTSDYRSVGYTVIWILHDAQFNKVQLSAAENLLRTTQCYFSNVDKQGKGIIYDQFEVIKNSRRLFKGPPLLVTPTNIMNIAPVHSIVLPELVAKRIASGKLCAEGDLLHRIMKSSSSLEQMCAIEKRFHGEKKGQRCQRLPIKTLIAKCYLKLMELWIIPK